MKRHFFCPSTPFSLPSSPFSQHLLLSLFIALFSFLSPLLSFLPLLVINVSPEIFTMQLNIEDVERKEKTEGKTELMDRRNDASFWKYVIKNKSFKQPKLLYIRLFCLDA
jgi:hypothetical protein